MPACSLCGHDNAYGTLTCVNCYSLLVELTAEQRSRLETSTVFIPISTAPQKRRTARLAPDLATGSIALYIDATDEPVMIRMSRQAILGRYSPNGAAQPRIDLTPFGGFDRGISRLHAILKKTDKGLVIEDLASVNGTWFDNKRLQPYLPTPIRSGDHVRLGSIDIEIHFDASTLARATTDSFDAVRG